MQPVLPVERYSNTTREVSQNERRGALMLTMEVTHPDIEDFITVKQVEMDTWKMLYENGKRGRRTGLGFTALADTLAALGLKFDVPAAIEVMDKMMQTKCKAEFDSSIDMAIERGKFEAFDPKVENTSKFVQN
ncbi:MAG: hypothetical protein ABJZ92_02950, partial [Cyclobacteriaceae bacterium]